MKHSTIDIKILIFLLILVSRNFVAQAGSDKNQLPNQQRIDTINAMYFDYQKSFKEVPEIEANGDKSLFENAVLVDVRGSDEQEISKIKNAISKSEFEKNTGIYKGRKIIVYCTIGYRSGLFVKKLRTQGFGAYNLKGGILLWAHAGKDVVSKDGPSKRVHVYGKKWDLLPQGWTSVY